MRKACNEVSDWVPIGPLGLLLAGIERYHTNIMLSQSNS